MNEIAKEIRQFAQGLTIQSEYLAALRWADHIEQLEARIAELEGQFAEAQQAGTPYWKERDAQNALILRNQQLEKPPQDKLSPADAEFARRHLPGIERLNLLALKSDDPAIVANVLGSRAKPRGEPSEPERKFEKLAYAALLTGHLIEVTAQPGIPFQLDGKTEYYPDFKLECADGTLIYVETKARWMHSENLTRLKLRQCSTRYPQHTWWLARWSKNLPWVVQEVSAGVIRRKALVVPWLN
jgi:hypothetical protein